MLNQIHQYHLAHLTEEKMLCYINEAYGDIIQFSRKASIYYSQSGFSEYLGYPLLLSILYAVRLPPRFLGTTPETGRLTAHGI